MLGGGAAISYVGALMKSVRWNFPLIRPTSETYRKYLTHYTAQISSVSCVQLDPSLMKVLGKQRLFTSWHADQH